MARRTAKQMSAMRQRLTVAHRLSIVRYDDGLFRWRQPVDAVSGFAGSKDVQRALEAGFDSFIPKPVSPDRLVAVVHELASRRSSASET